MSDSDSPDKSEDRRQAASLLTSLSSYVMTATLAVLGAQAVVTTFVIENRTNLGLFYWISGIAVVSLALSIILGGLGINEIIRAGATGGWKIDTKSGRFNKQAVLALFGAILVVVSAFLGTPSK